MVKVLGKSLRYLRERNIDGLRSLKRENEGSAVSFVIGMFVIIVIAVNLLPTIALQAYNAQNNSSVASFGGVVAMVGILVLLFVILPLVILAKAT